MKDKIIGLVSLICGIAMIYFRAKLAKTTWPFHLSQRTIDVREIGFLIGGLSFILFGILVFFHIIRMK